MWVHWEVVAVPEPVNSAFDSVAVENSWTAPSGLTQESRSLTAGRGFAEAR